MKIMFYKAKRGNRFDNIVDLFTGRYGYSHCELFFSDGISFSSSPRDGGCRFKSIVYDDKWVSYDLEYLLNWQRTTESQILENCSKYVGKKYDWIGIFMTFVFPLNMDDSNKWWCSEICGKLIGVHHYRISPNKLAEFFDIPRQDDKISLRNRIYKLAECY